MHSHLPVSVTQRIARYDTIVIGAGQAGLAVGYALMKHDTDFIIIDAGNRIGDSWRNRRHLPPAAFSGLPGMPFSAPAAHLRDNEVVAQFLERYAERFDLPVQLATLITSLLWNGTRYVAQANALAYEASNVVVATGALQLPPVPSSAGELPPTINQIHSNQYSWIQIPIELDCGSPVSNRGTVLESPGLYFLGFQEQRGVVSARLGGVRADARQVANHIYHRSL